LTNYFDFYSLEELFFIDEKQLKTKYIEVSKSSHPDFFINDSAAYQAALTKTSLNNVAYKALSNWQRRIPYILKLYGVLQESKNDIPQAFLMEMMDINEAVMDLQMEPSEGALEIIKTKVDSYYTSLSDELRCKAEQADELKKSKTDWLVKLEELKEIYLKRKYVLRLKETLNTFAPPN
jgi:molecular chaperone HscB